MIQNTDNNLSTGSSIISVGTAVPKTRYTQEKIAELLKVKSEKSRRFFLHDHISTRHLCIPETGAQESNAELTSRFRKQAVALSEEAALKAMEKAGVSKRDIDYICCVTSTGFIVPSLSLLIMEKMDLNNNCQRADIVGMGCSAGLNGLSTVSNWCLANKGKTGLLVCCEISSAVYVIDDNENTALVNSLFGDGVAAAIVSAGAANKSAQCAKIIRLSSSRIPNTMDLLRFDWNDKKNLNQFYVDKDTPERLAAQIGDSLKALLKDTEQKNIKHWIVHTGGAAILNKIEEKLSLPPQALRHSRSVLKNYGNVSSGSFLFSFERLLTENVTRAGDAGVMMTMGPGLAIEMALIEWQ